VRALALLVALFAAGAQAQEVAETRELIGRLGRSVAILSLTTSPRTDGDWRVTGEYLLIPSMIRRHLEGERSPQLGVTTLREGMTPIFFGRPAIASLQGIWNNGRFAGARFAPGGQERERFEFSEEFPGMDAYGASVRCDASDARYASSLAFVVEAGKLRAGSFEWRSRTTPSGHVCAIGGRDGVSQGVLAGGLRFVSGMCAVTLRDLGDYVRVSAENCSAFCGSQAYFEPLLVDKRAACTLMTPQQR